MFVVGLTTAVVPVNAPGFHVYDAAPLPVKVTEFPAHNVVDDALADTVGLGAIFTTTVCVAVQPNVVVPVTE